MQFPVDVRELQTPPLATMHRQAMSRRVPGDTIEINTEKGKEVLYLPKGDFLLMQISKSDIVTNI